MGKVPDVVLFGALSKATEMVPGLEHGVYMGSSMNAVSGDDILSAAMLPFVNAIATVGGFSAKAILSRATDRVNPPTEDDLYKAGKQLIPGIFQGYWDKRFMYPGSNVVPSTSGLEGTVTREPEDWNSLNWMGRRSITEYKEGLTNRIIKNDEKMIKDSVKNLVSSATDIAMGMPNDQSIETLRSRAVHFGINADDFDSMVVKELENRRYSQKYKEAQIQTIPGLRQQQQRRELNNGNTR